MTRRDAERHLEFWAALLAPEWKIDLDWQHFTTDGDRAEVSWSEDYELATIRVKAGWLEEDDVDPSGDTDLEREVDLVHEIVHVVGQATKLAVRSLARQVGAQAAEIFRDRFHHEDERATERLARTLVGLRYGLGRPV